MRLFRRQSDSSTGESADADALLVAWAQENPQAFTALYDRYFAAVYGYCISELRDSESAEDAASQTFLKALAALPQYRESGRFRSWLFAIAHNAVLDAIARRHPDEPLSAADFVRDPADSPEERALAAIDQAWLDEALMRLPADDRRVLELRRAGLSGQEIAETLGISHEAAKKRQLRAIDRIRADFATAADPEVRRGA